MARLRPDLTDLKFNHDLFFEFRFLSPPAFKAAMMLIGQYAVHHVWTYSPPSKEGVPCENIEALLRITGLTRGEWDAVQDELAEHFVTKKGKLFPKRDWFEVRAPGVERPAIPASVRSAVMQRDNFTCIYCGTTQGPFDLDHVISLAAGGYPTSQENLVCACARCNRSKRDRSVEMWVSEGGSHG